MIKDYNFVFRTNVSIDTYKSKAEANACLSRIGAKTLGKQKMAFVKQDVTVDKFLQLAISGHSFCNLFDYDSSKQYWIETSNGNHLAYPEYRKGSNKGGMKLSFKSDEFFLGTQTIFVDIDYTRFDNVQDYLATLTYPPTCVYMSFSDNIEKHGVISRRFRMVYIFANLLDKDMLQYVVQILYSNIEHDTNEPLDDDCGKRMSQYMNGVYGNEEVYKSYYIYSESDFIYQDTTNSCFNDAGNQLIENSENTPIVVFNPQLLKDMNNLSYHEFMHYYSTRYEYKYRVEKEEWIDSLYQLTDENYLQIWWFREIQVDGQRRRKKLFKNACLRRLMFPNMDADTMLFNLYVDFCRFFDNRDGAISLETLKRKVKKAFLMNAQELQVFCEWEIEYWSKNRPKFITRPGVKTTKGHIARINKYIHWKEIDKVYDRTKSVSENALLTGIPKSTLYRYCKGVGLWTNPNKHMTEKWKRAEKKRKKNDKIKKFCLYYNPLCTPTENQKNLNAMGICLSRATIITWAKKFYTNL